MEFFFPADVLASAPGYHPAYAPQRGAACGSYGPRSNPLFGCGSGSYPFTDGGFFTAIPDERAAYAAQARAEAQQARAEALRQAHAARRAAIEEQRRLAEERRAKAYFQHVLEMQRRQELLERQRELERQRFVRLQRQRQEAARREFEEYQQRRAEAIARERARLASARAAEDSSRHLFLVLEDLLFGAFRDASDVDVSEPAGEPAAQEPTPAPIPAPVDVKGKGKATEQNDMEVDNATVSLTPEATQAAENDDADADPQEVGPAPAEPESVSPVPASVEEEKPEALKNEILVFSHAFPADNSLDKASVKADAIGVSVDEEKRRVVISGLWSNDAPTSERPASPTPSSGSASSSRRGRSHSPKRAHVSDVDENGDEVMAPSTENEDFVHVEVTPAPATTIEKTFDLPDGADTDSLRAELSNDGLKLFATTKLA